MTAVFIYTPGSGEHGNPVFNRGSGGGARGCGFEERVGVYARTEGGHFLYPFCPSVCVRVVKQPLVSKNGLRERLRVCRGGSRNQLRGLKEGGSARRGAMLCLSADLTSHAFNVSTAHPVGFENGREREREGGAGAPRRTGRMNREGEVCSLVTCGVHFGARRRASARRRCVPRQLRLSVRSSECCGTREQQVSTAINHW